LDYTLYLDYNLSATLSV